jgi:hypothetical protein
MLIFFGMRYVLLRALIILGTIFTKSIKIRNKKDIIAELLRIVTIVFNCNLSLLYMNSQNGDNLYD